MEQRSWAYGSAVSPRWPSNSARRLLSSCWRCASCLASADMDFMPSTVRFVTSDFDRICARRASSSAASDRFNPPRQLFGRLIISFARVPISRNAAASAADSAWDFFEASRRAASLRSTLRVIRGAYPRVWDRSWGRVSVRVDSVTDSARCEGHSKADGFLFWISLGGARGRSRRFEQGGGPGGCRDHSPGPVGPA